MKSGKMNIVVMNTMMMRVTDMTREEKIERVMVGIVEWRDILENSVDVVDTKADERVNAELDVVWNRIAPILEELGYHKHEDTSTRYLMWLMFTDRKEVLQTIKDELSIEE